MCLRQIKNLLLLVSHPLILFEFTFTQLLSDAFNLPRRCMSSQARMAQRRISTKLDFFAERSLECNMVLINAVWLPVSPSSVVPRTAASYCLPSFSRPSLANNDLALLCFSLSPAYIPVNSTIFKENYRPIQLSLNVALLGAFWLM